MKGITATSTAKDVNAILDAYMVKSSCIDHIGLLDTLEGVGNPLCKVHKNTGYRTLDKQIRNHIVTVIGLTYDRSDKCWYR